MQHFHSNQSQSLLLCSKENAKRQKSVISVLQSLMALKIERYEITVIARVYIEHKPKKLAS